MTPAAVLLVHRRVNRRPRPKVFAYRPTRPPIRVQRKIDDLSASARAIQAGPFLDTAVLDERERPIGNRRSVGERRAAIGQNVEI